MVECWIRGELTRPTQGWLEIMEGEHPESVDEMWADQAITEGQKAAQNIITTSQGVS